MTDPSMQSESGDPLVKKVLLVVPGKNCLTIAEVVTTHFLLTVNLCCLLFHSVATTANWEKEIYHWLREEPTPLIVYNLGDMQIHSRDSTIARWADRGGVMLLSVGTFQKLKDKKHLMDPDVLCLDEAHEMLKTATTKKYKALLEVNCRRKIGVLQTQ